MSKLFEGPVGWNQNLSLPNDAALCEMISSGGIIPESITREMTQRQGHPEAIVQHAARSE